MRIEDIQSRMNTRWLARSGMCLECVDSTNLYAGRIAEQAEHGTLIVAEEQTCGKGRRGRSWETEKRVNVMMTLLLRPEIRKERASQLTLLMAMAVVRGIRDLTGLAAKIKWPNDIVVNEKKVCGILTEMKMKTDDSYDVMIGTGINVNQMEFSEELIHAGSLKTELGKDISREELIARILDVFEELYEVFTETEDLSGLYEEYNEVCVNVGCQVRVLEPGNEYVGTAHGINKIGELVVQKETGETVCVYAGEVSVRGLYGYV